MIIEEVDSSGAILFKRDEESLKLEDLVKRMTSLEKKVSKLDARIKELEGK